jgi:hypothetical protein
MALLIWETAAAAGLSYRDAGNSLHAMQHRHAEMAERLNAPGY